MWSSFRDGAHGLLAWAIAVLIIGLVAAASAAGLASKAVQLAISPEATAGERLIAYELDRLFRAERPPAASDLTYSRAEAGRILLAATGRQGITVDDRPTWCGWPLTGPALHWPMLNAGSRMQLPQLLQRSRRRAEAR
jgi:hypothetical protein